MNRRDFCIATPLLLAGCGAGDTDMQEFTLQPSPRLRQSSNIFQGGVEDSWTPTLSFVTPGDLNVVYFWREGRYIRIGPLVVCFFHVLTTTFTYSTSSGNLILGSLPVAARTMTGTNPDNGWSFGNASYGQGFDAATGQTDLQPQVVNSETYMQFYISSPAGGATIKLYTVNVPSGSQIELRGGLTYLAESFA